MYKAVSQLENGQSELTYVRRRYGMIAYHDLIL